MMNKCLFYIPTDIQDSENINAFVTDASKFILDILLKTNGKAFYIIYFIYHVKSNLLFNFKKIDR